jgi:acyl dehydratase
MSTLVKLSQVAVGDELPNLTMNFTRADLVKYAGASGDFNIIHWNERTAKEVGLPDVIAHGMLTMARAAKVVTDWVGNPGAVLEYSVRMTRPVVVPDTDAGVEVTFGGKVGASSRGKCLNKFLRNCWCMLVDTGSLRGEEGNVVA